MSVTSQLQTNAWHAMNLELIAFPAEPDPLMDQGWLEQLTGDPGESVRKRHERVDSSEYRGVSIRLNLDVARIRIGIGPILSVDPGEGVTRPPDVGPYDEVREWFSLLMLEWLRDHAPPIKRLAFVGKLMQWTNSRDESYQCLDRLLPAVEVDPSASEFQYRINRPRPSQVLANSYVNRLSTWSSIRIEMGMHVNAGGVERQIGQEFFGCMLQLDINTPQERADSLAHEAMADIWQELVGQADEITVRGEVR